LIVNGPVHTEDKLYDGAGYRGSLGLFSLEGMGNPPYDVKTEAGLLAFMREAVRRVATGDKGGEAMDRDGHGHDLDFAAGTAVAFILIPNGTFAEATTFLAASNPSKTNVKYPLTSLSFDTAVAGFSKSQAVSLGKSVYAIEDIAGGGDRDYEDIVWKTNGVTQAEGKHMQEVDASTYYTQAKLNMTGDKLLDGTDPTLRQVFQNMGIMP